MSAWVGDQPGAEGLAEWYELKIADDDAPTAKAPLTLRAVVWRALFVAITLMWSAFAAWWLL